MRKKLLVFIILLFIFPSFQFQADTEGKSGEMKKKDEVVYATLSADGKLKEIYVVNILDIAQAGKVTDYGAYENVENLTDLSVIQQLDNNQIQIHASKGDFYYQGVMKQDSLPWDIAITYKLDGKEVAPKDLVGATGKLTLNIRTAAAEEVDASFYQNYLLQISMLFDSDVFANIEADKATIANVGTDKQLTFTVMPNKVGNLTLESDVTGFEMQGIEISAVPSTMPIETPDTEEMKENLNTLSEAISDVHAGVSELTAGLSELNEGMASIREGSQEYEKGIAELAANSSGLIDASNRMKQALSRPKLGNGDGSQNDFKELASSLSSLANGLYKTSDELNALKATYSQAYTSLDKSIQAIPAKEIPAEQLQALSQSNANQETVAQLVKMYTAARNVQNTYKQMGKVLPTVNQALGESSASLEKMADTLKGISQSLEPNDKTTDPLAQLQALAANYREFHDGLESYANGVTELSEQYSGLHKGIMVAADGTEELEAGSSKLREGTNELDASTKDLSEEMQEEMDRMMADFDTSDFVPVSFVSEQNEKINNVQFVIKTDKITMKEPEAHTTTEGQEEKPGFWARLIDLFSFGAIHWHAPKNLVSRECSTPPFVDDPNIYRNEKRVNRIAIDSLLGACVTPRKE